MKLKAIDGKTFEAEVLGADKPIGLKLTANWCPPCKAWQPILEKAADELADRASIVQLDIDDSPEIAVKYGVKTIPTLIIFNGGEEVARTGRVSKEAVLSLFALNLPTKKAQEPK